MLLSWLVLSDYSTPWGEKSKSNVSLPEITSVSQTDNALITTEAVGNEEAAAASNTLQPLQPELQLHDSSVSSVSSINVSSLHHALIDKVSQSFLKRTLAW